MERMQIEIPRPPADMPAFYPDPALNRFLDDVILTDYSPFYNPEHGHLTAARIGFLWTTEPNTRQMRRVVGMAEMPTFRGGRWQVARQEMQIMDWFGDIPDFIVTISAEFAAEASPPEFMALFEHELYHCAQAVDRFGSPKFNRETGRPMFAIRGHDVEEFTGVVRRYGHRAAGDEVTGFIDAALSMPEISPVRIRELCGAC